MGVVIREAYRMQETTPPEIHPEKLLGSLVPLTRGTYPVFNKYPKFIVDYHGREREKIRREEEDYLRQRCVWGGHVGAVERVVPAFEIFKKRELGTGGIFCPLLQIDCPFLTDQLLFTCLTL